MWVCIRAKCQNAWWSSVLIPNPIEIDKTTEKRNLKFVKEWGIFFFYQHNIGIKYPPNFNDNLFVLDNLADHL